LEDGDADVVFIAREFLRDPNFALRAAFELGVDVKWPVQYHRAVYHADVARYQKELPEHRNE